MKVNSECDELLDINFEDDGHRLEEIIDLEQERFNSVENIDFRSFANNLNTVPLSIINTVRYGAHTLHLSVINSIDTDSCDLSMIRSVIKILRSITYRNRLLKKN